MEWQDIQTTESNNTTPTEWKKISWEYSKSAENFSYVDGTHERERCQAVNPEFT